jgi:hypothetical protein
MKSLMLNRVELVELYVEARAAIDDGALDRLVDTSLDAAVASARARFAGPVEVLVHVTRGGGRGTAAACRVTVAATGARPLLVRGLTLEAAARDLDRRGTLFVRDMLSVISRVLGGGPRALGRKEHRRKAPGKILELVRRMTPTGVLGVSDNAQLAARERGWLADQSAALMRSVHSPALFARIMKRLRAETGVEFVPADPADFDNLSSKLVGVSDREQTLHRRRERPRFKDRTTRAVTARVAGRRDGAGVAWFSA